MFTGLIEELGEIRQMSPLGPNQQRLTVSCVHVQEGMRIGDSLAIDGVCLTVVAFDPQSVVVEVSPETLAQTLFQVGARGRKVNLERALRVGDRLGGHLVQGHVDAIATLLRVRREGDFYRLSFSFPPEVAAYMAPKGSLTLNGISLTLASLQEQTLEVAVIPHTYQHTNLQSLQAGDRVHLESDILARYVEALLKNQKQQSGGLTLSFLREHGFGS